MRIDSITGETLEKNGVKSDSVNRKNISEDSLQQIIDAYQNGEMPEWAEELTEILVGKRNLEKEDE